MTLTIDDTATPGPTSATAATTSAEALVERLFGAVIAGFELLTVEVGRRLGLYEAVRDLTSCTAGELAAAAGIAERYAREWLEQQAAAGFLEVARETGDADTRRFSLPTGHATVLLDAEDTSYLMGAAPMLASVGLTLPAVVEAYRTGTGVAYADFGAELRHGIASFNRPMFIAEMRDWIATMPDVVRRIQAGGRVLDAGCGVGWSSIAIAELFPAARVVGVDMDEASIAEARQHAAEAGVADRVSFEVANVLDAGSYGTGFDLACIFEALHDMGEPIEALARLRDTLAPGAPILVADERVEEEFTAPAGEVERFQYAYSVLHCLPATMDESTAVANGTVLRPATVRAWAEQAGFSGVEMLPIENDFWRFYRLNADRAPLNAH